MSFLFLPWYIFPAAIALDLILGDPERLPHPIRWMGRAITLMEPPFRQLPWGLTLNGLLFALFLIVSTWGLAAVLVQAANAIHPGAGAALQVVMIYYCISIRSLRKAAMEVGQALERSGLAAARRKLAWIVGRETENLSEAGVARAAVETVAENLVDGVISPLFFAFIGGAPLALAYKMVNTLDSMVGYKNETYRLFGKAAARIDDLANFLPARLSVALIAGAAQLLRGRGTFAFATARKEGRKHTSPNAGFSEAAFAGTLAVRLGGPNHYHGQLVIKPYIGEAFGNVSRRHIQKACRLMILSSLSWGLVLSLMSLVSGG